MQYLTSDEIKAIELNMLKAFADYCEANGLHYLITFGTLLGAARHKGFIPWDDDIDVMMPRDDYDRFIRFFSDRSPIPNTELLYANANSDYCLPFAKLCDSRTIAKMQSSTNKHGIWIDIFPIDKVPNDLKKAIAFHKKLILWRAVIISYATDFKHRKFDIKTIPKMIFAAYGKLKGGRNLALLMEKKAQKYNNSNSTYYCPVVWQAIPGGILSENELMDCIKIPFEQYTFSAPRCYDKYLRSLYGDYTILPPENKRMTHGVIAYYKSNKE